MSSWKAMIMTWRMQQTTAYNHVIYRVNQFWFLKKYAFDFFYKESDFKWLFGIVTTFFHVVGTLVSRVILYLALVGASHMMVQYPIIVLNREQVYLQLMMLCVLFFRIIFAIEGFTTDASVGTYEIVMFQLPIKPVILARNITFLLRALVEAFLVSFFIKEISLLESVAFFSLSVALRFVVSIAGVSLYRVRDTISFTYNFWVMGAASLLSLVVVAFQLMGYVPNLVSIVFNPYHLLTSFFVFGIGILWLKRHQTLERIVRLVLRQQRENPVNVEQLEMSNYQLTDKIVAKGSIPMADRDGVTYLNVVFYERLKPVFKRYAWGVVRIMAVLTAICIAVFYFFGLFDQIKTSIGNVNQMVGALFVLSFWIYNGDKFVKLYFVQMDRMFLKFHYYRQPKMVHALLVSRLKVIVKSYFPVFLLVNGLLLVACLLGGVSWRDYAFVVICHSLFMLFWCVQSLYLYFAFQPYTVGMTAKSIPFQLMTGLTFFIGFQFSKVIPHLTREGIYILLACLVVYLILGYVVVYKRAPKYFVFK